MPLLNSNHFTSMRDQVDSLFKELKEIHHKFLTLLVTLVAATNNDRKFFVNKSAQADDVADFGHCALLLIACAWDNTS
ncbi:hypothetical protein AAZX31_18G184500 [Glycine max]